MQGNCQSEVLLFFAEYILPKKQMIYVCGYTIHHSKSVWGDLADEFRPERWLHQNPDSVHMNKQNFFAFGAGARQCPGSKLALLELKILLIRILQNFTLHLGPNQVGKIPLNILLSAFGHSINSHAQWIRKCQPDFVSFKEDGLWALEYV